MREGYSETVADQKKRLGIDHVFGDGSDTAIEKLAAIPNPELPVSDELEKTDEEKKIIDVAMKKVGEYVVRRGAEKYEVRPEWIHVVPFGTHGLLRAGASGFQSPYSGRIILARHEHPVEFANVLVHELLHGAGRRSVQITSAEELVPYRSGITSYDRRGEQMYFRHLEEALVAYANEVLMNELVQEEKIFDHYRKEIGSLREEYQAALVASGFSDVAAKNIPNDLLVVQDPDAFRAILLEASARGTREFFIETMRAKGNEVAQYRERREEISRMHKLIADIAEHSEGKYHDRSRVFRALMRAHCTGRYLPIARMIESALGKGSFRRVAEEFAQTIPGLTQDFSER